MRREQILNQMYGIGGFALGLLVMTIIITLDRTPHERCVQAVMHKMDKYNTNIDHEVDIMYLADAACADADSNVNRAMQLIEGLRYNH